MKTVVFSTSSDYTVEARTLDNTSIIGFEDKTGRRGFTTRKSFSGGQYVAMSAEGVNSGNNYGNFDSFKGMLEYLGSNMIKVLSFETHYELFHWVSKEHRK
jgi:hypothetical protein